ncbi:MAG: Ig-like domain-containing protein, partial [Anaerolineaceae bacterium]
MSKRNLLLPVSLLLIASLACSLPGISTTPSTDDAVLETEIVASPTPLPPLPPTLIESYPPPGVEFPLQSAITLFFDQAMDALSVQTAFGIDPPIETYIEWLDDRTLRVQPSEPLQYATDYLISVGTEARSTVGLALTEPILIDIHTVENLQVIQVLPEPDSVDVNPGSPITVVFNRPVVPLELEGDFPIPLALEPEVSGEGEWIDTSIFIFRPEPQFPGGITYNARIEAGLTDLTGGVLPDTYTWSFTTAYPEVEAITPRSVEYGVALDSPITLTFNQVMDTASVEEAFTLTGRDQIRIPGNTEWNEDQTQFTFTPSVLMDYNLSYDVRLASSARSAGGSRLTSTYQSSFVTVPLPGIISSSPREGGVKPTYTSVDIQFNAPMDQASLLTSLQVTPQVENLGTYWRSSENTLVIYGDFQPSVSYSFRLNQGALDPYGTALPGDFTLNFSTEQLSPNAHFNRYGSVLTLTTDGPQQIEVAHRNTYRLDLELYRLNMDQFLELIQSGLYRAAPRGEFLRGWSEYVTGEVNKTQWEQIKLFNNPLPSGTYLLSLDIPNDDREPQLQLVLLRQVELVLKSTTETTFIWAVNLSDGQPLSNHTIQLLNQQGGEIGRGVTDSNGVLMLSNPMGDDPYIRFFALSGSPEEDLYGLTANMWANGIQPYFFGLWLDMIQPDHETYLYTDRPIYRPGQTVHFRGVHRQTSEARYLLPDAASVDVTVRDERYEIVHTQTASLSEFGTFHGEYTLSEGAELGTYSIDTEHGFVFFDVAAYRKPEFTVTVEPSASQVASGDPLTATIHAEYFFGGPVADAEVHWVAWFDPFYPPGIFRSINWFDLALGPQMFTSFESSANGDGVTNSDGELLITLPSTLEKGRPARMTIEATITDSSGFPVTGRSTVDLHPATVYLTLSPEQYALRAGETAMVNLQSVDWA